MDISVVLSGIVVGLGFGFVLQRGRFCLNTAFRNAIYIQEFTLLRAYVLALTVTLIGSHALEQFGLLHLDGARQDFAWLANIIGGYLFGVGMVLAGGDAAATWSRTGEGLVGSWMAALGLMVGVAAAGTGVLSGISELFRTIVVSPGRALILPDVVGLNKSVVVSILAVAGVAFVVMGKTPSFSTHSGYSWSTTGALVGLVSLLGLIVSERMTGVAAGITFTNPSSGFLAFITTSKKIDWGIAMAASVPIGSFISAYSLHEFSWRAPRADVMIQQFCGGLIMGTGGMLANGCSLGHGITGLAALSLASFAAMSGIALGCWTMVYALFMRKQSVKY